MRQEHRRGLWARRIAMLAVLGGFLTVVPPVHATPIAPSDPVCSFAKPAEFQAIMGYSVLPWAIRDPYRRRCHYVRRPGVFCIVCSTYVQVIPRPASPLPSSGSSIPVSGIGEAAIRVPIRYYESNGRQVPIPPRIIFVKGNAAVQIVFAGSPHATVAQQLRLGRLTASRAYLPAGVGGGSR